MKIARQFAGSIVLLGSLFMLEAALSESPGAPAGEAARPPVARRVDKLLEMHGDRRVDPYFWLRDKPNPEVAAYLEAENAYAASVMKPTEPLQEKLYKEILSHIKETDLSVPYRFRGWSYYARTEQGKQYQIHCRKKLPADGGEGPEEVVLDLNEMAKGEKFMALGAYQVSDDGNLVAFSTDNTGFRQYTLRVKNLADGTLFPDRVEKVTSVAWAADGKTLFYGVEDAAKRSYRIYRHVLGTQKEKDALVYEEKDERFGVRVSRTRSRAYLLMGSSSHTASEVYILPAQAPDGAWKLVAAREREHEYDVDHRGGLLYIRTNSGGRNFRLVTAKVDDPRKETWKEIVPHRSDVMLEDFDVFANHLVLHERKDGLPRLTVNDLRTGASNPITFPEPAYALSGESNREFDTKLFRYAYQSFVTPRSVFDYDMEAGTSKLLKETEVPLYDRTRYASERLWATARDGVKVPVSIVYRKGVPRDGSAPLFLYAYGSYGANLNVTFSGNRLALLDRGVVVAYAHIRGGGDMGKAWHDDGRMLRKRNTFTDFIACAEFLVAQKIGSKDRLVIQGGSAGGLLMGAVVNMRPDLFKAVVAQVPFVDVLNTMSDSTLPLTVGEFEEWGNPAAKKDEYEYMKSYCPYTNVAAKAYPAMLVKTSFNDSQVFYHEPAKWVAKLRSLKTDSNPLVFKTNMAAGHGGSSGRYDALHETAFDTAFILWQMGLAG
jgi:oligopeptidase B